MPLGDDAGAVGLCDEEPPVAAAPDHIPAERWGEPVDLMGALVYLSSRASNYVNGHLLVVDGGYLVR